MYLGTTAEFVSSQPKDYSAKRDSPVALWSWSPWKPDSDTVPRSLEHPARQPFVPDEISSTTFQQQTLPLPPDSFLIEMQINLWLITLPSKPLTSAAVTGVCRLSNKWLQLSLLACRCQHPAACNPAQHSRGSQRFSHLGTTAVEHECFALQWNFHRCPINQSLCPPLLFITAPWFPLDLSVFYYHWAIYTRWSVHSIPNHAGIEKKITY